MTFSTLALSTSNILTKEITFELTSTTLFKIALAGVAAVAIIVFLLFLILKAFGLNLVMSANKPNTAIAPQKNNGMVVSDGINDEIVAVIAASISAMCAADGISNYSIKSIKRTRSHHRPIWAQAGINENVRAF